MPRLALIVPGSRRGSEVTEKAGLGEGHWNLRTRPAEEPRTLDNSTPTRPKEVSGSWTRNRLHSGVKLIKPSTDFCESSRKRRETQTGPLVRSWGFDRTHPRTVLPALVEQVAGTRFPSLTFRRGTLVVVDPPITYHPSYTHAPPHDLFSEFL